MCVTLAWPIVRNSFASLSRHRHKNVLKILQMKSRLVYQTLGMKTPAHTVDNAPHNALASSVLSERQQFTEPRLAEHCS